MPKLAAGAITGMRVCATMFVSGTLCWAVVVPILQSNGVIEVAGFAAIVQWKLWFGASCMVASGLLSFALSWRAALAITPARPRALAASRPCELLECRARNVSAAAMPEGKRSNDSTTASSKRSRFCQAS
jgi:uncharacterized oligopeptide transporter (OPT) family protein